MSTRTSGWSSRGSFGSLLLFAALSLPPSWSAAQEVAALSLGSESGLQEALLEVRVNGQRVSEGALVLRSVQGELLVSAEDLGHWRLRVPVSEPLMRNGAAYYLLSVLPLTSYRIDEATQMLVIDAKPEAFESTTLAAYARPPISAVKPGLGMFLNYDLSVQDATGEKARAGLFELGLFSRYGVFVNNVLWQGGSTQTGAVRLDSTWTTDMVDRLTTLRIGDAINQPGAWGNAVRFGGIQYGTNFATQPGYITIPLQSIGGQAALPSTVDVYVNNALMAQKQVPPGPFAIRDLPVVTGTGEITLVVRDVLGREQLITRPFTTGASLLRPGLSDFSFEAGTLRNNYGIESNDYGPGLATGTYRHGFTDAFTGEVHGELQRDRAAGGLSAAWLLEPLGILTGTVAGSHDSRDGGGSGSLAAFGVEKLTQGISLRLNTQLESRGFTQLGQLQGLPQSHRTTSASVSQGFGQYGSFGLAYVQQDYFDAPKTQIASLNYSVSLGRWGFLGVALQRTVSEPQSREANVFLTMPLGNQMSASLTHQTSSGNGTSTSEWIAGVQRNPPAGEGWGFAGQTSDLGNGRAQAQYQSRLGIYSLDMERQSGQENSRLDVQGGIGLVGATAFLSRPITDSFALVRLPDMPNVRVYSNNLEIGRTDSAGELILPRLRAYERNSVSVEQLDLGLDTEVKTLSLDVAPYYRSGTVVEFPIRRVRSATFRVVQADGSAVPTGAEVRVAGSAVTFPLGFDGSAYLNGLVASNRIRVTWDGKACELTLSYPVTRDPLPDLGTQVCKEVSP